MRIETAVLITFFDAVCLIGGEEDLDAGANTTPALVIVAIVQLFQFNSQFSF